MVKKLIAAALFAAAALPAVAGDIIFVSTGTSLPKDFSCGEVKKSAAGKYDLEVAYETTPSPHSVLKITKSGKTVCSIQGSGTTQYEKMSTSKTRLYSRFDSGRKATEIIVITPSDMREKVRNQVFYLAESETP